MDGLTREMLKLMFVFPIIGLIGGFIFWLAIRPLVLWYFKLNKIENLLTDIRNSLIGQITANERITGEFTDQETMYSAYKDEPKSKPPIAESFVHSKPDNNIRWKPPK